MGHPAIDEFTRIYSLAQFQSSTFRRLQRVFRDEVQPLLTERDELADENARLKQRVEALEAAVADATHELRNEGLEGVARNVNATAAGKRGRTTA